MTIIDDPGLSFAEGVEILAAVLTVQKLSDEWSSDVVLSAGGAKLQERLTDYQQENPGTGESYLEQLDLLRDLKGGDE